MKTTKLSICKSLQLNKKKKKRKEKKERKKKKEKKEIQYVLYFTGGSTTTPRNFIDSQMWQQLTDKSFL